MTYANHSQAWFTELVDTVERGDTRKPRGFPTRERQWVQFEVADPLTFPLHVDGREFADVIGVLEGLSLVGQFSVPEAFTDRVKKFREFTDAGVFHGSYGARIHGRLGDLVDTLARDRDTRQAVLTIYDSRSDLGVSKRDIPCTLNVQFLLRGDDLEARTTMRSNDLWLGTPYDLAQFSILQATVAQALGARPGLYAHSVGSFHVYERDLEKYSRLIGPGNRAGWGMPFPLWAGDAIADIGQRARRLCLDPSFKPDTAFEQWAHELLHG